MSYEDYLRSELEAKKKQLAELPDTDNFLSWALEYYSFKSVGESHVFIGRKQDLNNVAKWLLEQYQRNKRQKSILKLSENFLLCSNKETPFIRLNKKESIVFHDAVTALSKEKKSAALKKIVVMLDESLHVY